MSTVKLKNTEELILFDESEHVYEHDGKRLSGITGIIKKHILPDKYSGIPAAVLRKAAERGTRIHKNLEELDTGQKKASEKYEFNWNKIKFQNRIKPLANEYLVSDFKGIATAIDEVAVVNGKLALLDFKTTHKLDKQYLSWQLSIGKKLFETVNPDLKVTRLYGVHIDKAHNVYLHEIPEISPDEVNELLKCEYEGADYELPTDEKTDDLIQEAIMTKLVIKELKSQLAELEKQIRESVKTSYNSENYEVKIGDDYQRQSFSSKKLKKERPGIYEEYLGETKTIKGRLTYKAK